MHVQYPENKKRSEELWDAIIWMGDFNSRVQFPGKLDDKRNTKWTSELLKISNFAKLSEYD